MSCDCPRATIAMMGGLRKFLLLLASVGVLAIPIVAATPSASATTGLPAYFCVDGTTSYSTDSTANLPVSFIFGFGSTPISPLPDEVVARIEQFLADGAYYEILFSVHVPLGEPLPPLLPFAVSQPGGGPLLGKHTIVAGDCSQSVPPKPPPGPPGIKLCNVGWPSDPPIVVPGLDAAKPNLGDPAKEAIAGGQWRQAYLLKHGTTKTFSCLLPPNAAATGMVADDNDDEIPATLAAIYATAGIGETFAYDVYAVPD